MSKPAFRLGTGVNQRQDIKRWWMGCSWYVLCHACHYDSPPARAATSSLSSPDRYTCAHRKPYHHSWQYGKTAPWNIVGFIAGRSRVPRTPEGWTGGPWQHASEGSLPLITSADAGSNVPGQLSYPDVLITTPMSARVPRQRSHPQGTHSPHVSAAHHRAPKLPQAQRVARLTPKSADSLSAPQRHTIRIQ